MSESPRPTDAAVTAACERAASWLAGARRPVIQQGQPGPKLTLARALEEAFRAADPAIAVSTGDLPVGADWTSGVAPADLVGRTADGAVAWTAEIEVEHPDHVMWGALKTLAAARSAPGAAAYLVVAGSPYEWLVGDCTELFPDGVGERAVPRPTSELIRDGRVGWSAALAAHPGVRPLRAPRAIAATLLVDTAFWDDHELKVLALEVADAEPISFDRLGWPA